MHRGTFFRDKNTVFNKFPATLQTQMVYFNVVFSLLFLISHYFNGQEVEMFLK